MFHALHNFFALAANMPKKNIFSLKEQAMIINVTCSSSFLWLERSRQNYHGMEPSRLGSPIKIPFYGFLIYTNNLFTSFLFSGKQNNKIFQTN